MVNIEVIEGKEGSSGPKKLVERRLANLFSWLSIMSFEKAQETAKVIGDFAGTLFTAQKELFEERVAVFLPRTDGLLIIVFDRTGLFFRQRDSSGEVEIKLYSPVDDILPLNLPESTLMFTTKRGTSVLMTRGDDGNISISRLRRNKDK